MNNLLAKLTETKNSIVNFIVGIVLMFIATTLIIAVLNINPTIISIYL